MPPIPKPHPHHHTSKASMTSPPKPSHHNSTSTSFHNPWPSAYKPTWTELLTLQNPLSLYSSHSLHTHPLSRPLAVIPPDFTTTPSHSQITGTWLGHASALASLPLNESGRRLSVLFDPIFSQRAGPTQFTGPSRMNAPPCSVDALPSVDCVMISHNHYDHLDYGSIKSIVKKFPSCRYFVPLGNKSWFLAMGVAAEKLYEMDWWDEVVFTLDFEPVEKGEGEGKFKIACVPAQHNSGRGTLDQSSTLWSGWIIQTQPKETQKATLYHAGDTGYRRHTSSTETCPAFPTIGLKYGPIDLSFLPIWRGGTLGFISAIGLRLSHHQIPQTFHASPKDAVCIHRDVRSRCSVGVHFGTFVGSENESLEAVIEFEEAGREVGAGRIGEEGEFEGGRLGTVDIGGSVVVELL
ncbi:Metallo-hydrolase/oxidoreductase [Glarea lozoyensis ATCC 20868]|uniref:Metallo-hydrolase/oxidoreductase n=1 Tax=Glarea lozoyensis (strain ATCC 20868 / MF5171) TaxID=1116229 RepID=S3D1L0_GLAL2|nr:Metallo-hydrolase/oxidoreductase [Glarea lozoyensis ATCC 20868]EPE25916.1 Metallo-hydrolase/oxidoreductase [Glarea lozoyensis ATCC 20868]